MLQLVCVLKALFIFYYFQTIFYVFILLLKMNI